MKRNLTFLVTILSVLFVAAQNGNSVFSYDFTTTNELNEWVVIDNNGDGQTWQSMPGIKGVAYNGNTTSEAGNDWLISPAFEVVAGNHYVIEYTLAQRGAFGEDVVNIHYGPEVTPSSQETLLVAEKYNHHAGMVTRRCHITAQQSGKVKLGFNITSPASNGVVSIKSVSVVESAPQQPAKVPAMTASSDFSKKTVTIKWINPQRDVQDIIITQPMTATIYANGDIVTTLNDMKAGQHAEYTYTPTNFTGMVTYGVTMSLNGVESESVEKEINLDDFQGTITTIATIPLSKSSDFTSWKVENIDGGAKWAYEYKSVGFSGTASKPVDDWLFTPGVALESGKRYIVNYKLKTSSMYYADLDVTIGNKQASTAHTQVVANHKELYQNGFGDYQSTQFTVAESGNYYIGFHTTFVANFLELKDVTISYIEQSEGSSTEEVLEADEFNETVLSDDNNGDLSYTSDYFNRLALEGVELYGAFSQAQIDEYTLAPAGVFAMPYEKQFTPDLEHPDLTAEIAGGVTYHDGKIYCNIYNYRNNIQEEIPSWRIYDANTFELISENALNGNCENTTIALAYDASTDKIYGLVKDYVDTWLVEVEPATGNMTRIADRLDYTKRFLTLGCNDKGELYCVYMTEDNVTGDQTHYLGRINKVDGAIAEVGKMQIANFMGEDILYNMKYRQALFFDNASDTMYWMFCSSSLALGSQYAAITEINRYNAVATLRAYQTDIYAISGAYFKEPSMAAPSIISDVEFIADDNGANSGTLKFRLPATTYNGKSLESTVNYTVYSGEAFNYTGSGAAGEEISIKIEAANGSYITTLVASNSHGSGPAIKHEILIGYDRPEAPKNIVLTNNGLETTLTWDAPETGVYGKPFDTSKLTYTIVRYPGLEEIATGLTERVFVETHGPEMTRYTYAVYSCIDGERSEGALSNNLIVGTPLNTPYGGIFNTVYDMYNYYTIIDANNDKYSWIYDESTGAAVYKYNWQNGADDWLISPAINFRKDAVYTLTFGAFSSQEQYLESLMVTFGKGVSPQSQNEILIDIPELPAIDEDGNYSVYQIDITVPEDGVYHYGFKAYSEAYQDYLYLYDIKISSDKDSGIDMTVADNNATVLAVTDGNILKIYNPENQHVTIFNTSGILINTTNSNYFETELSAGMYIVNHNNGSKKVIIK